eukprot:116578_1
MSKTLEEMKQISSIFLSDDYGSVSDSTDSSLPSDSELLPQQNQTALPVPFPRPFEAHSMFEEIDQKADYPPDIAIEIKEEEKESPNIHDQPSSVQKIDIQPVPIVTVPVKEAYVLAFITICLSILEPVAMMQVDTEAQRTYLSLWLTFTYGVLV